MRTQLTLAPQPWPLFHPAPAVVPRWTILFGVSYIMFGCYYCYDNPAALNNYFTEAALTCVNLNGAFDRDV